ncbi:orotidine-5'-phosphate decarboxylase [Lacibacter luteus]|uniref:Orotidine-5'-phosphate decarboxylase n=1 Tax=Lacibacter luteus TaxID=2508719 RepID=A0A4Q1CNL1_9BACT|nr:orotidine-5'-phosphate decarboxylase [Lacibacter luteus]RXK62301.1 orotidine-5'-phosphate decarboxylase [Lacibacter luteus]
MTRQQLVEQIHQKQSYLCVGLDTDLTKIPKHLQSHPDAIFEFNKAIIDATLPHCVSYKINTAFYEAMGLKGWEAMERTVNYIPDTHFKIADAKRGDIGNTSTQYARAFFEAMNFDAVTVAPYMGEDSVRPFLEYEGKWAIVLGLTSNKGANDFELKQLVSDNGEAHLRAEFLYERVLRSVAKWGTPDNLMFVVGATQPEEFLNIRSIIPDHFLLVPGVGAQGGSLKDISEKAMVTGPEPSVNGSVPSGRSDVGLLVNASRAVIYASGKEDFATEAKAIAEQYQFEMKSYLG